MRPNSRIVIVALYVLVAVLLLRGILAPYGGELDNPYPLGYLAGDTMWHYAYSDALRDEGSTRELPSFFALGEEGLAFFQPVIFYHLAASFADLTGVPTYEATMILVGFMGVLIGLLLVAGVRRIVSDWAYLALPMTILVATSPFVQVFSWGFHIAVSGFVGLALFAVLINEKVSFKPLVIGAVLSFCVLAFLDAFVYALAICLAFVGFFVVKGRWGDMLKGIKPSLIALTVVFVMTGWYFLVMSKTWFVHGSRINWFVPYDVPWDAEIVSLGVWAVPVLVGLVVSVVRILKDDDSRYIPYVSLFLLSLSLYIGLERIVRYNFLLPMFLAPLVAIAAARIPKRFAHWSVGVAFVSVLVVFFSSSFLAVGSTMMSPVEWYAIEELSELSDDPVLFVAHRVGTGQNHALFGLKRTPVFVEWSEFESYDGTLPVKAMCGVRRGIVTTSLEESTRDFDLCFNVQNRDVCDFSTVYFGAFPNEQINAIQNEILNDLTSRGAQPILQHESFIVLDVRGACS